MNDNFLIHATWRYLYGENFNENLLLNFKFLEIN